MRGEIQILNLKTAVSYKTNGTQKIFSFPFDYIRASFVRLMLDDADTIYTYGKDYVITGRQIEFLVPPPANATLTIYRETPTDRLVAFAEGSVLRGKDMTISQVQQLHILEEQQTWTEQNTITTDPISGQWQGKGKRLTNIADPIDTQDVATKGYLESVESGFIDTLNFAKDAALKEIEDKTPDLEGYVEDARSSAEKAARYESGVKKQLFTSSEWLLSGDSYRLSLVSPQQNGLCIGVDRDTPNGTERVLDGIESIDVDHIQLTAVSPYSGIAYFATFTVGKNNRYKKIFTTQDWQPNGIYRTLTVDYIEHSLGIDAIVELIEKQINNNVYTNTTVQVDRQPNGSFVIYAQEAFNGQIILTGGVEQ